MYGCVASITSAGLHFILGNGLAGGRVWLDVSPPTLIVNPIPAVQSALDDSEHEFPEVFAACAVTHPAARAVGEHKEVSDTDGACVKLINCPLSVSCSELITEQQSD